MFQSPAKLIYLANQITPQAREYLRSCLELRPFSLFIVERLFGVIDWQINAMVKYSLSYDEMFDFQVHFIMLGNYSNVVPKQIVVYKNDYFVDNLKFRIVRMEKEITRNRHSQKAITGMITVDTNFGSFSFLHCFTSYPGYKPEQVIDSIEEEYSQHLSEEFDRLLSTNEQLHQQLFEEFLGLESTFNDQQQVSKIMKQTCQDLGTIDQNSRDEIIILDEEPRSPKSDYQNFFKKLELKTIVR